ncbi:MAG: DNA repair protein RecN, partial [Candidatus Cloacimonadota bacterium]|nr:DNA repair protein RecN [Candidatus Cloacimonadota bacterium]
QVLTGETGAGKSIIVGALNILLGNPIKKGLLFDPTKKGYIEAGFTININNKNIQKLLKTHNIEVDENEIFFGKEITTSHKGKSYINGRRVTNAMVKDFSNILLDFHSQRDQILLLDKQYQLNILDKYAVSEKNLLHYRTLFYKSVSLNNQLIRLEKKEREAKQQNELFQYQYDEIEKAKLQTNEDATLQKEYNILANAETIIELTKEINFSLYESENSSYDNVSSFTNQLSDFSDDNKHLKTLFELLQEVKISLESVTSEIESLDGIIELDEKRLSNVENRLDVLNSLSKKYGKSINEIIEYKNILKRQLSDFDSFEGMISNLKQEILSNSKDLVKNAEELSQTRKKASKKLNKEIESNLKLLSIPDISFDIKFKDLRSNKNDVNSLIDTGFDEIDFYMSANKGVEVQPMKDAASGGELSRILLTIKKILSANISGRTIIFDEIDSGVGGKTAEVLGQFIKEISNNHQVLLITHLPQIAAFAGSHFVISKSSNRKKTKVNVILLDEKDKIKEIARMLSGSLSSLAKEHATELLKKGREREYEIKKK